MGTRLPLAAALGREFDVPATELANADESVSHEGSLRRFDFCVQSACRGLRFWGWGWEMRICFRLCRRKVA